MCISILEKKETENTYNSIELDSFEFFEMKNKFNLKFYSFLNLILNLNFVLI
jgi:hypothetical protein